MVENSDGILALIGAIIMLTLLGAGFGVFFKKAIDKLKQKRYNKKEYESQLWRKSNDVWLTDTDDDDH